MKASYPLPEQLTRRENDILFLLNENLTDREIAERLVLSIHSVKWYVRQVCGKLQTSRRREAVAKARALGLFSIQAPFKKPEHNLPRQLSSFIGRERETAQVVRMVLKYPLVTLSGAGGMGKTRLALHSARELIDAYPDGVWWVELATITDPAFVLQTVASVLNVPGTPEQNLSQKLRDHLRSYRLLLILDNCEHVIDVVATLCNALLKDCPNLSILVTSRELINVEGEAVFRCPPLSLPETSPENMLKPVLESAQTSEAVRLFVDRAVSVLPDFQLTEQNAPFIINICQRLDGMPLAIELAAARLRLLTVEQIVGGLNHMFQFLTGSRRAVLPRHKSLKAMIDWSYQLLSPGEQMLLRRMSVFAGGWTLAAAEAMAAGEGFTSEEIMEQMGQLADKSFIHVQVAEEGEYRYRMLETIRQYASERIQEAEEYSVTRDRHLAFFAEMAEQAKPLDSQNILSFHDANRMMKDFDNVRLALAWALDHNIALGLRLCLSFIDAIPLDLYFELGTWLERLLDAEAAERDYLETRRDTTQIDFLRGQALVYIGESSYIWGQRYRSEQALLKSIAIFEAIGEPADYLKTYAQMSLGTLLICTDPEQSRVYLESSRDTIIRMGRRPNLPDFDRKLAVLNLLTGRLDQARQFAEEDLALSKEFYDIVGPPPLEYRGCVEFLLGNYDLAIEYFHQGMEIGIHIESLHNAAYMGWMEGCVALAQGNIERLLRLRENMLRLGQETNSTGWFFYADTMLAMLEWIQGNYDQAVKRSQEGLVKYYPENLSFTVPFPYVLGKVALAKGELASAEHFFRQVDEMANAPPLWRWKAVSLNVFGLLAAAQSERSPAMAERAALLFSAQEKLFPWLPNVLSPFERSEYQQALTFVQNLLSEQAFSASWARGQGMTYRHAFSLALEGTSDGF